MFQRLSLVILLLLLVRPAFAAGPELTLERVLLSQGGVGYFEYAADVDGNAELDLTVPRTQVDDILKSVVVYDSRGGVGGISLEGEEPLAEAFRKLPFGQDALGSPVELLNALQGAQIEVGGPRPLSGRVLQAVPETVRLPDGQGTVVRHRVTVMTLKGLKQFVLEEAESVAFADLALSADVEQALEALVANRARDDRTLTVLSRGEGQRTVRVGYVVATPLWKTSYRLTLQDDAAGLLQGWAIVENLSGQAWDDVELTLTSGNPVTFRQALYQAYFVDRPEVPVEVMGRVLPKVDEGAVQAIEMFAGDGGAARQMRASSKAMPMAESMEMADQSMVMGLASEPMPAPPPPAGGAMAVESSEATSQVTFRFPDPVSVPAGESFAVPIVDRPVPAAQVALYEPETHDRHPLLAVRLENNGATGLPPGVLTLYETGADGAGYVGDARMGPVAAGDERLLSFSLDSRTLIDREARSSQEIGKGTIADGLFRYTRINRQTTTYRIEAPANEPRRLIITQPRWPDWRMVEPDPAEVELTDTDYRLTLDLAAGEARTVDVVLERPIEEVLHLADLDLRLLAANAESAELTEELRKAFAHMARLKRTIDERHRDRGRLEAQRAAIVADQERLRENLAQVPQTSDLHARYLAKLAEQENELESLVSQIDSAQAAIADAEDALRDYIGRLSI